MSRAPGWIVVPLLGWAAGSAALPPPDGPWRPPRQYDGPAQPSTAEDCAIAALVARRLRLDVRPDLVLTNPLPPSAPQRGAPPQAMIASLRQAHRRLPEAQAAELVAAGRVERPAYEWRCSPGGGLFFQKRGAALAGPGLETLDAPLRSRDGRWALVTYFRSWRGSPQQQEDCLLRKQGSRWRLVRCEGVVS